MAVHGGRQAVQQPVSAGADGTGTRRITHTERGRRDEAHRCRGGRGAHARGAGGYAAPGGLRRHGGHGLCGRDRAAARTRPRSGAAGSESAGGERISNLPRSQAAQRPARARADLARPAARRGARARARRGRIPHQALSKGAAARAHRQRPQALRGAAEPARGGGLSARPADLHALHPQSVRRPAAESGQAARDAAGTRRADHHKRRAEPRALGHDGVHRRECAAGQPHAAEKDDGVPRHVPAARVRARRRLPAGGGA